MPKDTSSSSEDEADNGSESTAQRTETNKKTTMYDCPQDFVSFHPASCSSMLSDNLRNGENELWLIKAPSSFNPKCFRGLMVPLSGLHTMRVPSAAETGTSQIYSVLASSHCSPELRLLTSDGRASDVAAFGPSFSGLLNVCESYGDSSTNQAPQVIPAAPAPSIPPGLKQRFHPFGSKTPTLTYVAENEADGAAFGPSSTTLRPLVVKRFLEEVAHEVEEDDEDGRRKKKKKKKEKRVKMEVIEEILKVKQEPVNVFQEAEHPVEKSKKKKKKKKKEKRVKMEVIEEILKVKQEPVNVFQEAEHPVEKSKKKKDREVAEGQEPSMKVEQVSMKCEPMDCGYGDVAEFQQKKKKKKKKHKTDED